MGDKALDIPIKMFCSTGLSMYKAYDLRKKLKFLFNNLQ
jgi:hypothetical protein